MMKDKLPILNLEIEELVKDNLDILEECVNEKLEELINEKGWEYTPELLLKAREVFFKG